MEVISSMKVKPASYEHLINRHGVRGTKQHIGSSVSVAMLSDESEMGAESAPSQHREIYFSGVFLIRPWAAMNDITPALSIKKPISRTTLLKWILIRCIPKRRPTPKSGGRTSGRSKRSNRVHLGCETSGKRIKDTKKIYKNNSDETKSLSSKDEAMRVLQEWSTAQSPHAANQSRRNKSSIPIRDNLNLHSSRWNGQSMKDQDNETNDFIEQVEASFWAPMSTKSKGDSVRSTGSESHLQCHTGRLSGRMSGRMSGQSAAP